MSYLKYNMCAISFNEYIFNVTEKHLFLKYAAYFVEALSVSNNITHRKPSD